MSLNNKLVRVCFGRRCASRCTTEGILSFMLDRCVCMRAKKMEQARLCNVGSGHTPPSHFERTWLALPTCAVKGVRVSGVRVSGNRVSGNRVSFRVRVSGVRVKIGVRVSGDNLGLKIYI